MTLEELRAKYHEKVIPRQARSEIRGDFMKEFGYVHNQQFAMKLKVGSLLIPTPKEFDWLCSKIEKYYNYYLPNTKQLELPHEKVA
ncbi:hypothetical protein [Runella sp. SP2]|uniref:hypothetical protein n=1 Tax=Runella sp. SP2 TaxID=2268026 RepID=UPI000F07946E|nr:hypothetical protein [Runella sp. SP2]AYQ31407.1 hypothetical protein DTQ70_04080 [Runella sp. SP2]